MQDRRKEKTQRYSQAHLPQMIIRDLTSNGRPLPPILHTQQEEEDLILAGATTTVIRQRSQSSSSCFQGDLKCFFWSFFNYESIMYQTVNQITYKINNRLSVA